MLDFLIIGTRSTRSGMEIFPKFKVGKSKDLLIRGGDFYAVWDEEAGRWSKDQDTVIRLVDNELTKYYNEHHFEGAHIMYMWDGDSKSIDKWHHYVQKQSRDSYEQLDDTIIFADQETTRDDYSTFCLPYALKEAETPAYDELISTLYSPEERQKIEWAIGSVVCGDSKWIQKFCVFVGDAGTGKSTILMIIRWLFGDYCATIDAKAIGSNSASFALESLRGNPLVAVQDDTDLSKIEDNARLNSLISHEPMNVNEKFKSTYENTFHCMLFLGSNKEVQITDSKSGIIRRLIDISPTGEKLSFSQYQSCMNRIKFELGGIAWKCLQVYQANPDIYHSYVPTKMMRSTNVVYSFFEERYSELFKQDDGISLAVAYMQYKEYCDESDIQYHLNKQKFKVELFGYFKEFYPETRLNDGTHVWNYFKGFRWEKLGMLPPNEMGDAIEEPNSDILEEQDTWIVLKKQHSLLDDALADCPAQYATKSEKPQKAWDKVETKLKDLNTSKTHYCKVPDETWIFIDFDLKNERGEKDAKLNLEAASAFPPTYVENSKGGSGLHLHYIFDGDPSSVSAIYSDGIEIKVLKGNSSLRRRLTKCNDIPIAHINSGLPLKEEVEKVFVKENGTWNNQSLRTFILRALNKEYQPYSTVCNIDYIYKKLEEMQEAGISYDVSDMYTDILNFAYHSSNNKDYCVKVVDKMKLCSEEQPESVEYEAVSDDLIFFDVEVFPNLFVVVWKPKGKNAVTWINPTPHQIEYLCKFRIIGFNNRGYDNHILMAAMMGYANEDLYHLSKRLISGDANAKFRNAFNLSYTDIYDFASAMHKMSLKKWEIKLGILHKELGLPWDKPVPEELWHLVAEYCVNDVVATEAVFETLSGDWTARQILADLAGMTVNDTTNQLTTAIIFEGKKKAETDKELVYTDLSTIFPGYKYEFGKSTYRGVDVGEGGFVYAEPGMYQNVALLDIASMHPTSIEQLNLFGKYTKNYSDLKKGRIDIKHQDWDDLEVLLNGKLKPYVDKARESGDMSILKDLSNALKTALNSAYGLTSAKFENQLRHKDNVDNIVAKRGSLFMVNLLNEVQARGFTVAHIKTDSIKIPNATPEIIQFVTDYGKQYGYDFEHEATYERICLVNDAVYIARYDDGEHEFKLPTGEKVMTSWTATGTQFQVPYVFKTLFSHDKIVFNDLVETKQVKTALYLDMNESLPNVETAEKQYKKVRHDIAAGKVPAEDGEKLLQLLQVEIDTGHDYKFVGRVGAFCPMVEGIGAGLLVREKDGKFGFATGAKGYRWLEAPDVKGKLEDKIDYRYFNSLVDDAKDNMSNYGDIEWFLDAS